MNNTMYLKLRGNIWSLNYREPKDFMHVLDKEFIQHSLKTDSLKQAIC